MKKLGYIRKIDKIGKILIPKEMRDALQIDCGSQLEFYLNDEGIVLKKHEPDNISDKIKELKSIINEKVEEIGLDQCIEIEDELNKIEKILNTSAS